MSEYLKTKPAVAELIRVANRFLEERKFDDDDANLVIQAARKIASQSFSGTFPTSNVLLSLKLLLADQNIQYAVIGGLAMAVHGMMRATDDIDVLASALPDVRDVEYARKFGFYRASSSTGNVMGIDHRQEGHVEVLLANSRLERYAIETAVEENILGQSAPVVTPLAFIGLKVRAIIESPGRDAKDSIDIVAVAMKNKLSFDNVSEQIGKYLLPEELDKLRTIMK